MVVFDRLMDSIRVCIFSTSAAMHERYLRKIQQHTEYDTEFGEKLNAWRDKKYFDELTVEKMLGGSNVIIVLTFITTIHHYIDLDQFKKELNDHLCGYEMGGVYEVNFTSFVKEA
jgi:hypothetical protein